MTVPASDDSLYVRAFACGNDRLQARCYRACRQTFNEMTARLRASHDDLEDIFHVAFELLWSRIDTGEIYVAGAGVKCRTVGHPRSDDRTINDLTGSYFAGIVRNKFLEYCRAHNRTVPFEPGEISEPQEDFNPADDPDTIKDRLTMQALNSLPRSCIEILTKFYHESKSLNEILAERPENSSYDGLKSRKAKCLKLLKEKIITIFKANGLTPP